MGGGGDRGGMPGVADGLSDHWSSLTASCLGAVGVGSMVAEVAVMLSLRARWRISSMIVLQAAGVATDVYFLRNFCFEVSFYQVHRR